MQIIQCENCGKRYKVEKRGNNNRSSKYKCNACSHIIKVHSLNSETKQDPTRPSAENHPIRFPEKNHFYPPVFVGKPEFKYDLLGLNIESPDKKYLSLRSKFNITIGAVLVCAIVVIYFWSEHRMQNEAQAKVLENTRLLLATMEASRDFTSKIVKPALYKAMPDRFVAEGMSSSFGARNIFDRIRKVYPQYSFKHAAPYPRNLANQADAFEINIIKKFEEDRGQTEWRGYRTIEGRQEYSVMKPIIAEQRCMRCHSDPAIAPQALLEQYGNENGFGSSVGEVIGALSITVPSGMIIEQAQADSAAFTGIVVLFFGVLICIANIFFQKVVLRPIKSLADNAGDISLGKLDTVINTSGGDEIAKLAKAFERMKTSIKMAFEHITT